MRGTIVQRLIKRAPELTRAGALFLVLFAFFFVGYTRRLPAGADEMLYFGLTQSLAKWQAITLDQISTVGPGPEEFGVGGHRYSKKGPLQSILAVPLFWLAQALPIGAVDTVLLLNHLLTALTIAIFFLLVGQLGYSPGVALTLATIVAVSTPLWVYTKSFFSEPTITLCVVGTLFAARVAAVTRRPIWCAMAGFAFGAAIAAKNVNALLLLPVPLYLGWTAGRVPSAEWSNRADAPRLPDRDAGSAWSLRRGIGALVVFGCGAAPVAVLLMLYSYLRYGTPFSTGYGEWETFSTPVWEGVFGLLFSPGKSILVYTPLFLLLPFWAPAFVRRFGTFAALVLAIVGLHLVVYGSWYVWWGAWGWGSRFTVPILPLLALLLAEGLATRRRTTVRLLVAGLTLIGIGIQALGVAVSHEVYMIELLAIHPRPDTLTLYDLARSPILNQIRFLTPAYLDLPWIDPDAPGAVHVRPLTAAVAGLAAALVGGLVVWKTRRLAVAIVTLAIATGCVAATTFEALQHYYRETAPPAIAAVSEAIVNAPGNAAVLHLIPNAVVPYANWQKRSLPELGWIEEPEPNPLIRQRLDSFGNRYDEIWVVTEAPPRAPSNGVEAWLNRQLVPIGHQPIGPFRLLRYATRPEAVDFIETAHRFAEGIELTGFAVNTAATPGTSLDVTLRWRAGEGQRTDYTVFVHLITDDGTLIAQHDGPPGDSYLPTSAWAPGQVTYDLRTIAVPVDAPAGLHLLRVGLYLPADGTRLSVLDANGNVAGDFVTLDLSVKPPAG